VKGILYDIERIGRAHTLAARERGKPPCVIAREDRDPISTTARHMS
jgi:hypothetical protein